MNDVSPQSVGTSSQTVVSKRPMPREIEAEVIAPERVPV